MRGRSYAPRGHTPEVRANHKRANLGLISAITNKGKLRWMVLDSAIKASILLRFLSRLARDAGQKVFLKPTVDQDFQCDHVPPSRDRAAICQP